VQLDFHVLFPETKERLDFCRQNLALPLAFESPPDDKPCIVEGSVLPADTRRDKRYVWFHVDGARRGTGELKPKAASLMLAHLRYRERPSGPVPKELSKHKSAGLTTEWLEKLLRELRSLAKNNIVMVEAELALPGKDRSKTAEPVPPIQLEKSTLRRRGEEYRSADPAVGGVMRYRWLEKESGEVSVWIAYSHIEAIEGSIFKAEETRCRAYLKKLL
jgi:hypothetical protein